MLTMYFWIDGERFDPDDFQSGLAADLRGTVESRKRIVDGRAERYGRYWKSEVLTPTASEPEEELARLLSRYRAELVRARAMNGTRVMAEIVSECGSPEDVGGFYFSADAFFFALTGTTNLFGSNTHE